MTGWARAAAPLLALTLGWTTLRAQEPAPEAAATPAPLIFSGQPVATPAPFPAGRASGGTTQLSIYLVLMLALLGGGVYVLRNGWTLFQPKPKGPRKLQLSETRTLGGRQFLVVAEYENRKVLIGVCPGRINYLCTLSGGEPDDLQMDLEDEL